jgi:hypothetical protein
MKYFTLQYIKRITNVILFNFTLAKFISAFITITLIALIKYWISGGFILDYNDLFNNIALGLLSWLINTGMIGLLTDYLGIRGINFNLKQFLFGFETMKATATSNKIGEKQKKISAMINLAMESSEDLDMDENRQLNKGKGIDRSEDVPLDKGKQIEPAIAPPGFIWSQVFPGVDLASIILPKKTNPGPGFNVPGGIVPINDQICQHIDYNTHILSQFKNMSLETAIEQRNNYLAYVKLLEGKLAFAQNALTKVPENPTTDYEFRLRNQILRDLDSMGKVKVRNEARATLLGSRIEFIENRINAEQNNK